jgi:hypothetical protein
MDMFRCTIDYSVGNSLLYKELLRASIDTKKILVSILKVILVSILLSH